jgi:hypothetical protein
MIRSERILADFREAYRVDDLNLVVTHTEAFLLFFSVSILPPFDVDRVLNSFAFCFFFLCVLLAFDQ